MTAPVCSVVVPVFNRAHLTRRCLEALFAAPDETPFEVIVVDNGSRDDTQRVLAGFSHVRVITNETNRHFATACNQGAQAATGEWAVFLNNDTLPRPGWLDSLVRMARREPRAGVIGSKLLYPGGLVQHAGMVICQDRQPRILYAGFPGDHPAVNRSREHTVVCGACILVPRATFLESGMFDTAFVNGYEDLDLCVRLRAAGRTVHYCHESELTHLGHASEGRFDREDANRTLFHQRWSEKLVPDDLAFYAADGLLKVEYAANFVGFRVAPELGAALEPETVPLLELRAKQVWTLLCDNSSLRAAK